MKDPITAKRSSQKMVQSGAYSLPCRRSSLGRMTSTLELSKRFTAAGFTQNQAETLAEVAVQLPETNLATKAELKAEITGLRSDLTRLEQKVDLKFEKIVWMSGVQLTLALLILGKLFFK